MFPQLYHEKVVTESRFNQYLKYDHIIKYRHEETMQALIEKWQKFQFSTQQCELTDACNW